MNKQDLLTEISKNMPTVSKNKIKESVEAVLSVISEALAKGDKVTLSGFGTFYVGQRQEKKGTNPRTKQPIVIPAASVPKFRPAYELKKSLK